MACADERTVSGVLGELEERSEQSLMWTRDRAIPPPLQRRMVSENKCADVIELDTDHTPQLSYRVDRIRGARITQQTFVPRYEVELTPSGPLPVTPTTSRAGAGGPRMSGESPRRHPTSFRPRKAGTIR
jgi:hypothetical protein